jgi:hypothetical protein
MLTFAVVGASVFVPSARGQRRGGLRSAPASRAGFARMRRFQGGLGFAPYYSDYDAEPAMLLAPAPQMFLAEPQPASPAPKPAESLVLELQGDHWVRVTNYGQSEATDQDSESALPPALPSTGLRQTPATKPLSELPPAVLVFRDGHKEEIGKYLISGTTIYASADYWSTGSWTRKVQIAELDVPATLKLNQERGARFSLPSGPNEVMIRP